MLKRLNIGFLFKIFFHISSKYQNGTLSLYQHNAHYVDFFICANWAPTQHQQGDSAAGVCPCWQIISGREEAGRIRISPFDLKCPVWKLLKSRIALLVTACVLLAGGAVGGTLAWMMDKTAPLRNTFVIARMDVKLTETPTEDGDSDPNTNGYTMLPGGTITKDPVVTLTAGSDDAWLFVKLEKSANFDRFLSFSIADGWTALDGVNGVYWQTTRKSDTEQTFGVLKDHAVIVKPDVTAAMLNALTDSTRPTLAVTAYAVQKQSVGTASQAWTLVESQSATP